MLQLTLIEKLQILFDLILTSSFFIFLLIFTILVFIILLDSRNHKRKKITRYIRGIYALVFVSVIIKFHSSFLSIIDYLINNIFVIFYFPNIAIYAAMIIIINIIMLRSLFSNKNNSLRLLNIASYSIIMYLMLLVIYTITTQDLNVYDPISLYTNKNVLVLIEISNILFVIWMILLLINKILDFSETKGIKTKSNFIKKEEPTIEIKYIEKEIVKEVPIEKIIYKEKQKDMFTKEEYLTMLKILKNQKDLEEIN